MASAPTREGQTRDQNVPTAAGRRNSSSGFEDEAAEGSIWLERDPP